MREEVCVIYLCLSCFKNIKSPIRGTLLSFPLFQLVLLLQFFLNSFLDI